MAAPSFLLTEDDVQCSICLDVFTEPVSTPCGHNFCKDCISEHWNTEVLCKCPICKAVFCPEPDLQVNTLISEMTDQFRQLAQQKTPEEQAPHHICTGSTVKVLLCLAVFGIMSLAYMKCNLLLEDARGGKRVELGSLEGQIQQKIKEDRRKISDIRHAVVLSENEAAREMADCVQVFTAMKEAVERSQAKLMEAINKKLRSTQKHAEDSITELEEEISELKKRRTEAELFSVPHLEELLAEELKKGMPQLISKAWLRRIQQYAVDLTLDPDTAHPSLILSDDGKEVRHGDEWMDLPDNPERFDACVNVLGKQSFSSGRFYYEVQVKGKTEWDLGVVRGSIGRKGKMVVIPQNGFWAIWLRNGNEYEALAGPAIRLSLKSKPEKVGVFVDYEEGVVSFYDANTAALLYSYTGVSFNESLCAFFSASLNYSGKNSLPLVITPVEHAE